MAYARKMKLTPKYLLFIYLFKKVSQDGGLYLKKLPGALWPYMGTSLENLTCPKIVFIKPNKCVKFQICTYTCWNNI